MEYCFINWVLFWFCFMLSTLWNFFIYCGFVEMFFSFSCLAFNIVVWPKFSYTFGWFFSFIVIYFCSFCLVVDLIMINLLIYTFWFCNQPKFFIGIFTFLLSWHQPELNEKNKTRSKCLAKSVNKDCWHKLIYWF